jgi:hypothetical protein
MSKPPIWKVKREVARAYAQLLAGPSFLVQFFAATPYHDRFLAPKRRMTSGRLARGDRVAIYLIFPKSGVLRSHLRALNYLVASGYAPLVVSNCPLAAADLEKLAPVSWTIMERQNFGYDFGGYRDAVLFLDAQVADLTRLALFNDSTWFPLPGAMDWLAEAEALGVAYAAASWSGAIDRPAPKDFTRIEWHPDKQRRNFHYASFALCLSQTILQDPDFLRFWQKFRLTQDKSRTVRRGEIGLTKWVLEKGFSHGSTTELANLGDLLHEMPDVSLLQLFRQVSVLDDAEMTSQKRKLLAALERGQTDRNLVEKLILMITARRGAVYALADYLIRERRFAFLKKSLASLADGGAAQISALASDFGDPVGSEILQELALTAPKQTAGTLPGP